MATPSDDIEQEALAKAKIISWVKAAVAGDRPPIVPVIQAWTDSDYDEHGMVLYQSSQGLSVGFKSSPPRIFEDPRIIIAGEYVIHATDISDEELEPDELAEARAYLNPSMTGTTLRTIREGMGLTASSLAQYLQVQTRTVQRWEAGERGITKAYSNEILELRNRFYDIAKILAAQTTLPNDHPAKLDESGLLDSAHPLQIVLTDDSMPAGWHRALGWHVMESIPNLQLATAADVSESILDDWRTLLARVEDLAERRELWLRAREWVTYGDEYFSDDDADDLFW